MSEPTRSIKLYGTDQPTVEPRVLKAGALSAELEAGNLRQIRLGGVEVIRAISYIVRDKDGATYSPVITELEIDSSTDRFEVSYSEQPALVETVKSMVSIESGSGDVAGLMKMATLVEDRLKALGFRTERRKATPGAGADIVVGT